MCASRELCMSRILFLVLLVAACQAAQASGAGDLLTHTVAGRSLQSKRFWGSLFFGSSDETFYKDGTWTETRTISDGDTVHVDEPEDEDTTVVIIRPGKGKGKGKGKHHPSPSPPPPPSPRPPSPSPLSPRPPSSSPPSPRPPSPSPSSPPPPPPKYPNCKTYKGPWGGRTLFQLATDENTTPYDIHTYPYTGEDITRGLDPDTKLEELKKKFQGYAELKICPGEMKFVGPNSCLDDLYNRRPCAYLKNKSRRYECLCSFRPDGNYRDPYDKDCKGTFTCKGWKLVAQGNCGSKAAAPEDYRSGGPEGATVDICVASSNYFCKVGAPCTSASCMCDTYLLPNGQYINPWDSSGRTWVTCDHNKGASIRWVMPAEITACDNVFQYYNPAAYSCQNADKAFCRIQESDGKCEVAFVPFYTCEPDVGTEAGTAGKKRRKLLDLSGGIELPFGTTEDSEPYVKDNVTSAALDMRPYEDMAPTRHLLVAQRASGVSVGGTRSQCQKFDCCKTEFLEAAIGLNAMPPRRQKKTGRFPPIQSNRAKSGSPSCRVYFSYACPTYAQGKCRAERLIPDFYRD